MSREQYPRTRPSALLAEVDILGGTEVLHNYGDLGDADLLNIFGFVDTQGTQYANPHNKVPPSSPGATGSITRPP